MNGRSRRDPRTYAVVDPESRTRKGEKIGRIVSSFHPLEGAAVLDVGTGNGVAADHLSKVVGQSGRVIGVDSTDQRDRDVRIEFKKVDDVDLPFPDGSFDVVVSNHVIEHVGDRANQFRHLREIRRVLRPEGVVYLAQPNRWAIIEPHFRLPLLSWLPTSIADKYVRWMGVGEVYDCRPFARRALKDACSRSGFVVEEVTAQGLKYYLLYECGYVGRVLGRLPDRIMSTIARVWCIPTIVFVLRQH